MTFILKDTNVTTPSKHQWQCEVANRIVLKEIDIDFFSLFQDNHLEQAKEEMDEIASEHHPLGKWCKERGIKLQQSVLTSEVNQMHKMILYAAMTDVQQTEYVLRF